MHLAHPAYLFFSIYRQLLRNRQVVVAAVVVPQHSSALLGPVLLALGVPFSVAGVVEVAEEVVVVVAVVVTSKFRNLLYL